MFTLDHNRKPAAVVNARPPREIPLHRHQATWIDPTVIPGESAAAFDEYQAALRAEWAPNSVTLAQLVDELAHIQWTIRRIYLSQSMERGDRIAASTKNSGAGRLAEAELLADAEILDRRLVRLNHVRLRILNTLQRSLLGPIATLKTRDLLSDPPLVGPILDATPEPGARPHAGPVRKPGPWDLQRAA